MRTYGEAHRAVSHEDRGWLQVATVHLGPASDGWCLLNVWQDRLTGALFGFEYWRDVVSGPSGDYVVEWKRCEPYQSYRVKEAVDA